ncbi:unnamed protein product [Prunus brigantina]
MYAEPLTSGDYPQSMRSLVGSRLPKFTKEQSKLLIGSFDFLGLNYYAGYNASDAPQNNSVHTSYITDGASDWLNVYPRGIQDLLLYTKNIMIQSYTLLKMVWMSSIIRNYHLWKPLTIPIEFTTTIATSIMFKVQLTMVSK